MVFGILIKLISGYLLTLKRVDLLDIVFGKFIDLILRILVIDRQ